MKFKNNVIDSHIHLFAWFGEDGKTFIEAFDDYQKRFGIKALNLCSCPFNYSDVSNNIMCAIYKLHNPTAYAYGGLVYPEVPAKIPQPEGMDALSQYNELMEIGFDGIKLIETKPSDLKSLKLDITNSFYDSFFAEAEKNGTHFIWHVSDPETNWDINTIPDWAVREGWYYGDGTYPSSEEIFKQVFEVLKKYQKLNVTFAHFFFLSNHPDVLEEIFKTFENVSIDIVPGSEMYGGFNRQHERYTEFFTKYADRIIYGTDITFPVEIWNWDHLATEVYNAMATDKMIELYSVECKGFSLPDEVCEKIFSKNFISMCSENPKPVNVDALKRYIEKYKHLIADEKTVEQIMKYVENL